MEDFDWGSCRDCKFLKKGICTCEGIVFEGEKRSTALNKWGKPTDGCFSFIGVGG